MSFWVRVKEELKRRNTTLDSVATKTGINIRTIYGWIAKDVLPRVEDAVAIAFILDRSVEYFVTGGDTKDRVPDWYRDHWMFIRHCQMIDPKNFKLIEIQVKALAEYLSNASTSESDIEELNQSETIDRP